MNRRTLLIIIIILTLIGGGLFWFLSQKGTTGGLIDLFPGESSTRPPEGKQTPEPTPDREATSTPTISRLYKLHQTPVAGVGFVEEKTKEGVVISTSVRYVEKALGHIYETTIPSYKEQRIVNETRPRIAEAFWGNNGNSVVLRFVGLQSPEIIQTRILNLSKNPTPATATSTPPVSTSEFLRTEELLLPELIPFLSVAEDGTNGLFYLEAGSNASMGTLTNFEKIKVSKIFSSSFTEWLPQFPNTNLIALTSRPSSEVPGNTFFLDTKTKNVSKVLSNIPGLTSLVSPDGKFILYSETKLGFPELFIFNVAKKTTQNVYLQTLPEKCAWAKNKVALIYCGAPKNISKGLYPDQWYQGTTSFSDDLWTINTNTMEITPILSLKEQAGVDIDILNMSVSTNNEFLVFIDKKTGSPWIYSIVEPKPVTSTTNSLIIPPASTTTTPTTSTTTATTTKQAVPPGVISPDMQKLK